MSVGARPAERRDRARSPTRLASARASDLIRETVARDLPMQQPGKTGYMVGAILMLVGVGGRDRADRGRRQSVVDTGQRLSASQRPHRRHGRRSPGRRYNAYYEAPGIKRRRDIPPIQIC